MLLVLVQICVLHHRCFSWKLCINLAYFVRHIQFGLDSFGTDSILESNEIWQPSCYKIHSSLFASVRDSGSPYITMVALSFKRLFTSLSVLVSQAVVNSSPSCSHDSYTDLNAAQAAFNLLSDAKNAAPPPPHFVIYGDKFVSGQTGPPPVADIKVRSPIFRSSLTL